MLRVLHLLPTHGDFQTERCFQSLSASVGHDLSVTVRRFGPGGDYRHLPEAIFRLRRDHDDPAQIAHAWSPAELLAAAGAGFTHLVFSPQSRFHRKWWRWIQFVLRRHSVEIVCPTRFMRDQFIARGAPADRCHVIAPAVDDARLAAADPEVRQRLGIAPDDLVLVAPGESSRDSLHRSALWATAILNFLDPRYRLLIWGHGPMVESLQRFATATEGDRLLISARAVLGSQVDFEQIIPAADAALYCAQPGSPILPAAICLAAGLPMVATASAEAVEFLHDRDNALLEPSLNPRCLAERVRDLQADAGILQSLTRHARQSAEKDFSIAQNIAQWRQLYSTLAGFAALDFTHSPNISASIQGSSNVLTGNSESVWATSSK